MTAAALTLPEPATGPGTSWPVPPSRERTGCRTAPARRTCPGTATDLGPVAAVAPPARPARQINWDLFPVALRASFKRAGWALVNLPTPDPLLERAATCRARQPATGTIASTAEHWRRYAAWLAGRAITSLADVSAACHGEWAAPSPASRWEPHPRAGAERGQVLWGSRRTAGPRPCPHAAVGSRGCASTFPQTRGRREQHAPVHPAVMSADLGAGFTEDFAADILAALAEHERFRPASPPATTPKPRRGSPPCWTSTRVPAPRCPARRSKAGPAPPLLLALTSARAAARWNTLRRARLPAGGTAPLGTPVTGQLRGKPWTGPVSYHQAPALALRLSAACLIVVAYLSGLRPAELLHLQPGCCPVPADDGTGRRYRLHGVKFKAARNDDGTPAPTARRGSEP